MLKWPAPGRTEQRCGLEEPALIGHDIGGAIALRTHLLEHVPVSHLGLIDAVVLAPWIMARTRQMQDGERGQALYLRNLVQFDEDHTRPLEPLLASIAVPTAIVWGEQDAWLPVETSERIARGISGATSSGSARTAPWATSVAS